MFNATMTSFNQFNNWPIYSQTTPSIAEHEESGSAMAPPPKTAIHSVDFWPKKDEIQLSLLISAPTNLRLTEALGPVVIPEEGEKDAMAAGEIRIQRQVQ